MADYLDYLAWRGDLTFEERPLNEIDCLILSELAYLDMDGIAPGPDSPDAIPLAGVFPLYEALGRDQSWLPNDPRLLADRACRTARFGPVRFGRYVNRIDRHEQSQFSAVTCFLPGGGIFAAFRGTDNDLVGWREDFNFSFMDAVPAQKEAVAYLDDLLDALEGPVTLGGHSKGGNLAVYAAAFCRQEHRDRVFAVYSFDGPGFNEAVASSPEYEAVLPKVRQVLPESSLVGLLLHSRGQRTIIASDAKGGIRQHNPYSWQLTCDRFLEAPSLSPVSVLVDEALDQWIDALAPKERSDFVMAVFDALDAAGLTTLSQLSGHLRESFRALIRAAMDLPPDLRSSALGSLKKLALTSRDILWEEFRQSAGPALPPEDTNEIPPETQ